MTLFSRSRNLRKPRKLAVKRLNYMKTAITSNVTNIALFRIRAPRVRTPVILPNGAPGPAASGLRVITAISENSNRPGPALDLREGGERAGAAHPGGEPRCRHP